MKKKIISLLLVLVLAMVLMLPAFAAVGDTVSPNACSHSWRDYGSTSTRLGSWCNEYHIMNTYGQQICSLCTATREVLLYNSYVYHNGNPCGVCGYLLNKSGENHTHE